MTAITDIEVSFYVLKYWQYPGSPYVHNEELFESDIAELHTSEYENGPQTAAVSGGVEVYNKNGIQITAKCIQYDSEEYALDAMVFVNNQSDQYVYVRSEGVKVNQRSFMANMRCGAEPGYTTMSLQRINKNDLRSDGILPEPRTFSSAFSIMDEFHGNVLDQISFSDIPLEAE